MHISFIQIQNYLYSRGYCIKYKEKLIKKQNYKFKTIKNLDNIIISTVNAKNAENEILNYDEFNQKSHMGTFAVTLVTIRTNFHIYFQLFYLKIFQDKIDATI